MDERIREIHTDVRDIKGSVQELVKQMAVNTHILAEHEKRSTSLETLIQPLLDDFKFRRRLYVLIMGSSGILAVLALLVSILTMLKRP